MASKSSTRAASSGVSKVARFPTLEPWYDWGIMHVCTMDTEVPYQRRFFDLGWFGIGLSLQIGRIRQGGM